MSIWKDCEGNTRRGFLRVGSAGLLGLSLPNMLRLEAKAAESKLPGNKQQAKSVILVWLGGGPATIDMWDLKPEAPEAIRGEFKPIDTNVAGLKISEHLPKMAKIMDKVTLIRSMHHTIPSHGPGTIFMTTGNKPIASMQYPSMGSLTAKLLPVEKGVPPYVSFSELRTGGAGGPGYLGTSYSPFMVEGGGGGKGDGKNLRVRGVALPNGFTLTDLDRRDQLLQGFDQGLKALDSSDLVDGLDSFHKQALEILRSDKTIKAFDLTKEPTALREKYGSDSFGQAALAARRLIEAGVRFTMISSGMSWDTHSGTFTSHKTKHQPTLDRVLSTLISDLDERGMLANTIVMCAGEFGRTPKVNAKAGRDHWARSMSVLMAGGGFKRGYVHGSTDGQGMAPATEACTPDDLASTIFHNLGIDPQSELQTPTGRPMQLFREGRVIEKVIG